jgi:hypothetical protein
LCPCVDEEDDEDEDEEDDEEEEDEGANGSFCEIDSARARLDPAFGVKGEG